MKNSNSFKPNRLVNEVSPYLLQHAYNPVDWYPWGDEAFEKAKKENKLLLISIGYSSCHWCHVMENESFTDEHVAKIMNERYVCIKVDREERPDIDQIYMNAVQIITGRGGWPLNCFALPDGRPVYGGTYFPKENWASILESLDETWKNEPNKILEVADEISQGISKTEIIHSKVDKDNVDFKNLLQKNLSSCKEQFDLKLGGTRGAPKFPMPGLIKFLLTAGQHSGQKELLEHVFLTLEKIANGGIYDHIGGGFFRYSVDEKWFVPHFEKMLYDNAQLVEVYSLAYRINPNPTFKKVVEQTISFAERHLQSQQGGFYSSLDADTAGQEGGFYTWQKSELEQCLKDDSELLSVAYGITPVGNWENKNIPFRALTSSQLSSIFGLSEHEVDLKLESGLKKLNDYRSYRVPPIVDDKIITSWNALMISGLIASYNTFAIEHHLDLALGIANYITNNHITDNGEVLRITCKEKTYGAGLLDDYAFTANAFIQLFLTTHDKKWIDLTEKIVEKAFEQFFDDGSGMFFFTPHNTELIVRKMELMDGVMPSASAIMVKVLNQLAEIKNIDSYRKSSYQMLANVSKHIEYGNVFVYEWANQILTTILPTTQIKINTANLQEDERYIKSKIVFPNVLFVNSEDIPNKYLICIGNVCQSPTDNIDDIVKWINAIKFEYY
jgi:hypothetical protein